MSPSHDDTANLAHGRDYRGRSETLRLFLMGAFLYWMLPAVVYVTSGRWGGALVNGLGSLLSLATLALWSRGRLSYPCGVRAALAISLIALVAESFLVGGADSQPTWYLPSIALAAGYLCYGKEIVFWGLITAFCQLAIRGVETWYRPIPEYVIQGWELSLGQVLLTVLCASFAYAARRMAERSLEQVLLREKTIMEQSRALEDARDQAVAATQAKSRFLSTVSHEIRTPLFGILGAAQSIDMEQLSARDHENVLTIVQSGELLLAVLNDILDSAKLDAGELSLHHRSFDLRLTLEAAARLIRPLTERKGLELVVVVEEQVPRLWLGDDVRLRQILLNLLSNACKFSHQGVIRMEAWGDTGELKVAISDQGIGITPEDQASLFQPFRQVGEGDARPHDGSGLGLWIVRRLADLMHGQVDLVSEPGQGSTFTVRLPLIAIVEPPRMQPSASQELPQPLEPLRVLVVDDNPVNRKVTLNLLKRLGHTAEAVEGGREALQRLEQESFQVILMDLQMPEMDGITATRAIRQLRIAQPYVVAFSADAQAGRKLEIGAQAFNAFLAKPLRLQQLGECLNQVPSASSQAEPGSSDRSP